MLGLLSCGSHEKQSTAPAHPLDESWIGLLPQEPQRFSDLMNSTSREGWIAFHKNDWQAAARAFADAGSANKLPQARALWELHLFYGDLTRSADHLHKKVFDKWKEKSAIPKGSALPFIAGLAALDSGRESEARAWMQLGTLASDPKVAALSRQLETRPSIDSALTGSELSTLLSAHATARKTGDCGQLIERASKPMVEETFEGARHRYADPLLLRTLSTCHGLETLRLLGGQDPERLPVSAEQESNPFPRLLFGPVTSLADARAESERADRVEGTWGAHAPFLQTLGMPSLDSTDDDPEIGLTFARALDEKLELWASEKVFKASPDGQALYHDLSFNAVWRSHLLTACARDVMLKGQPRKALSLAWSALDLEKAGEITPVNHPALLALIVEGQLKTGRTREALEAMQTLLTAYPDLMGLNEVIGDLAILEGMSRYGDSKEN